ncbi:hypothetical protein FE773_03270 [Caminibacter mediatlanticus TB-2]|uniref:HTH cro/C1-type domain-containing protein n=1 Tax=Caminibacter mediatlanticus TB-2 TaxID=391592 RepID=A0ABX5V7H7_9BACT|nr:hypothetical protein [Caminibacter mediatlanticus]QCT94232.1 hypothetical protein FE773_03270 [Caminibacter mediatlanticus TB-2]
MSANKFFEQFSIDEISKRTKISPISLRFIKNKEYEKIPKVKFLGFIKIIEREFNVDLSDIIEEYNQINHTEIKEETIIQEKEPSIKKEKNYIIFILGIILLISSAILLYKNYTNENENNTTNNKLTTTNITEINNSLESNKTQNKLTLKNNVTTTIIENNLTDKNLSQETNKTQSIIANTLETNITNPTKEINLTQEKKAILNQITIIPQKLVWYRIKNLDTNKTSEYLTSKTKTFKGKNFFIKFGHGEVTIKYGNQTITPNTKKIVRILIKNGKYQFLKKGQTP